MSTVNVTLLNGEIPPASINAVGGNTGAALKFQGVVRDVENDRPIVALFYEAYAEMAKKELTDVCDQASELFDLQRLECWHRVGEVPVDGISLQVVMLSRHRRSGLEAMAWLIREIKSRVPIWKWGITAEGERFPSKNFEEQTHDIDEG